MITIYLKQKGTLIQLEVLNVDKKFVLVQTSPISKKVQNSCKNLKDSQVYVVGDGYSKKSSKWGYSKGGTVMSKNKMAHILNNDYKIVQKKHNIISFINKITKTFLAYMSFSKNETRYAHV